MGDKYFKLVCFVVNICPEPLREFFIKLAKDDAGTSYTDSDAYLSQRHQDVIKLKRKRKIRDDQYDLLYPGHGTADVNQWDVTLLITLITEMFDASLQPMQTYLINEIRGIRNQLQHLSNTSSMSDEDFDIYWGRLDTATMTLAKEMFNATHEAEFRQKICDAKTGHLPDLGDALRIWYEETIRQMADTIQDMKIKLDEVGSNTREAMSILRKVTVEKPGPAGDKNKRIKTVDGILKKLQASFEATIKELPDNFSASVEVSDIRTKLRDNHHVIVTGSYNSRYFETALAAIKGMDYDYKRSVEMHTSSDWRHIDPEDVDLVLCRNPFGNLSYDGDKSKSMADIFNSMMHTTKGDDNKTLDIIMVTDSAILAKCKQFHDHNIFEDVVNVFDDTSETHPADLTLECRNQDVYSAYLPVSNNLKDMTINFLKQYRICSGQVDEEILKKTRLKFKANKAVVLTGPKKCGKTSFAVAIASSYDPSQCILLTEPNDFKTIDLQNTCLVIIDEFTGKYCYDKKDVYKWYSMFDHLYNATTAGQMNVIITCEKSKLDKCCDEVSPHPLLEHRVNMPERTIAIKQEMLLRNTENALSVVDNTVGSVNCSANMETSRMGIVGAFNTLWGNDKLTTILRLPQEGTVQDQYISRIGIPGSVQNFVTSRNLFPTTRNNILPAERGDIVDNYVGSTDTGTMMEPSREGISEAFNMSYRNETEKTILRLPQPDRAPDQSISHIRMPASLQNFTTRYRRHILPEQILSTERGVVTDHLSSTHGHQRIQRVAHNQTSIPSAQRLTGSHVWSVKEKHKCNIRVNGDVIKCDIRGCCRLTSGEILLADHVHSRLKKLNDRYQVISVCKMPPFPNDVCYIGNNVAVVSLTSNKLQFIDIREGMTLTRSVDTDHSCWGLAYGNNQLYVVGDSFVCIYSKDGIKQHILYTHQSRYPLFRNIALSDDGCLIYISNMYGELVTVDSSGNHMCPFTDTELREASGVCVDGEGHVLVSCYLDKILQLSFDGKMKLGIIANRSDNRYSAKTLCFDKENTILVAAGCNDNIWVLKLQL